MGRVVRPFFILVIIMKKIKYLADFFVSGARKYQAGETYDVTEETASHAVQGHAEEVEMEEVDEGLKENTDDSNSGKKGKAK